jgi:hypothetical protein
VPNVPGLPDSMIPLTWGVFAAICRLAWAFGEAEALSNGCDLREACFHRPSLSCPSESVSLKPTWFLFLIEEGRHGQHDI